MKSKTASVGVGGWKMSRGVRDGQESRTVGLKTAGRHTSESNLAEIDADGEVRKVHQSYKCANVQKPDTQG